MGQAKNIQRNEGDSISIFEERSVENDYRTLIPLLKPGLRVLDIGCGTGAITRGLMNYLGENGFVTGIDSNASFIRMAKIKGQSFQNLEFVHCDLFLFEPDEKYDLVIVARTLQWLPDPQSAVEEFRQFLKWDGQLSVLDYNHLAIEWHPTLPDSMQMVYEAFLAWRSGRGLNNQITEDLPGYFRVASFWNIEVLPSNEVYEKDQPNFMSKLGIWDKVAKMPQLIEEGYLDRELLLQALSEYENWKLNDARRMVLNLKEVRGRRSDKLIKRDFQF